jgi:hypothetical protein
MQKHRASALHQPAARRAGLIERWLSWRTEAVEPESRRKQRGLGGRALSFAHGAGGIGRFSSFSWGRLGPAGTQAFGGTPNISGRRISGFSKRSLGSLVWTYLGFVER